MVNNVYMSCTADVSKKPKSPALTLFPSNVVFLSLANICIQTLDLSSDNGANKEAVENITYEQG